MSYGTEPKNLGLNAVYTAGGIALLAGGVLVAPIIATGHVVSKLISAAKNRPVPTAALRNELATLIKRADPISTEDFVSIVARDCGRLCKEDHLGLPPQDFATRFFDLAEQLYGEEALFREPPPLPDSAVGSIEEGRYRDALLLQMRKLAEPMPTLDVFRSHLALAFTDIVRALPRNAGIAYDQLPANDDEPLPRPLATIPIIDVLSDPRQAVLDLCLAFYSDKIIELNLFRRLRDQLDENLHKVSDIPFTPYTRNTGKFVFPPDYDGSPTETVSTYLKGTPLEQVFDAQVPFDIPDEARFEHTHVVAGTGWGKTQLLQHLILHDLQQRTPPSLIIIDSQGGMLRKIERLNIFAGKLADKLIIIDPERYSPALNMFDTTNRRIAAYSQIEREQIEAGVLELYDYIFSAIAAEMTSRQSTAFAYVTRLMLSIPGATIHTFRRLMEDSAQSLDQSSFAEHIAKLDPTAQDYFSHQFFTRRYSDLKQQIARRLYGVLSVPAFDRMFSGSENKLDMFEAMQSGKIVLVNTSKSLLKKNASALFGRYMIALTLRAAYERVATEARHPAFLIVDEAQEYFDANIQTLLEQARKFNVGLIVSHQNLDQLGADLFSAIAANTTVKLAGGLSARDTRSLAPDMRTSIEFLGTLKKRPKGTEFACHVRNYTETAVRLAIPFGSLEAAPKMSEEQHRQLLEHSRQRYATAPDRPHPEATVGAGTVSGRATVPPTNPATSAADDWRS